MTTSTSTTARPGSRWRAILRGPTLRTWVLYVPLVLLSSAIAASTWDSRRLGHEQIETASGLALLVLLAGLALGAALALRRRYPEGVAIVTAAVTLLLPLDPVAALIAFGSLAVRRLDRIVAGIAGLTFLSVLVSTWRDAQGLTDSASFWRMITSGGEQTTASGPLSNWVVLAISLGLMATSFGIAMLVRDLQRTRTVQAEDQVHRQVVAGLNDELARQAERERLAQEVHDALGHRLSLLSLHAGALQMRACDDPALRESADLVRWGAEQAMTDLRSLLTMLRQPGTPDVADSIPSLRDMALLIDETSRTGVTLVSTVQLESIDDLDDLTSRTAFRIVQELLTNARRHAPGLGVRILVRATPNGGVEIEAANHILATADTDVVPGSGLSGIANRVEQLGGQWRCWVDEQRVFRAAAHLPWVPRRPDASGSSGASGVSWGAGAAQSVPRDGRPAPDVPGEPGGAGRGVPAHGAPPQSVPWQVGEDPS